MSETVSPDANVEQVRAKLLLRSQIGLKKYGVTTERNDLDLIAWVQHLQEELMDAAVYAERLIGDLRKLQRIMAIASDYCINSSSEIDLKGPTYSLAEIENELELQSLEIGDLEK